MPRNNPPMPAVGAGVPVMRSVVTMKTQGQLYEVILDYLASAAVACNRALQDAFKVSLLANVQAPWLATLAGDVEMLQVSLAEVAIGVCPTATYPIALTGTSGDADSQNGILAAVVSKASAVKGQHGRGRAFFGPLSSTFIDFSIDPNVISAAGLAKYLTLTTALMLPIVTGATTWNLVISTRPIRPQILVTNAGLVNALVTNKAVGTVRRRKEGRGQ